MLIDILRGLEDIGDPDIDGGLEVGSVLRSGGILKADDREDRYRMQKPYC